MTKKTIIQFANPDIDGYIEIDWGHRGISNKTHDTIYLAETDEFFELKPLSGIQTRV